MFTLLVAFATAAPRERLRADARGLLEEAGVVRSERFVAVLAPSPGLPPVAPRKRAAS